MIENSDQPALLDRRFDKAREQGVRLEWAAFQLGMELDADEPRMVGAFDDFGQAIVGAHSGEQQPAALERLAIMDVDLVAMAMALADVGHAVERCDTAVASENGGIGAQPHGSAEIAAGGALLKPLLTHPFGDQADDG